MTSQTILNLLHSQGYATFEEVASTYNVPKSDFFGKVREGLIKIRYYNSRTGNWMAAEDAEPDNSGVAVHLTELQGNLIPHSLKAIAARLRISAPTVEVEEVAEAEVVEAEVVEVVEAEVVEETSVSRRDTMIAALRDAESTGLSFAELYMKLPPPNTENSTHIFEAIDSGAIVYIGTRLFHPDFVSQPTPEPIAPQEDTMATAQTFDDPIRDPIRQRLLVTLEKHDWTLHKFMREARALGFDCPPQIVLQKFLHDGMRLRQEVLDRLIHTLDGLDPVESDEITVTTIAPEPKKPKSKPASGEPTPPRVEPRGPFLLLTTEGPDLLLQSSSLRHGLLRVPEATLDFRDGMMLEIRIDMVRGRPTFSIVSVEDRCDGGDKNT